MQKTDKHKKLKYLYINIM